MSGIETGQGPEQDPQAQRIADLEALLIAKDEAMANLAATNANLQDAVTQANEAAAAAMALFGATGDAAKAASEATTADNADAKVAPAAVAAEAEANDGEAEVRTPAPDTEVHDRPTALKPAYVASQRAATPNAGRNSGKERRITRKRVVAAAVAGVLLVGVAFGINSIKGGKEGGSNPVSTTTTTTPEATGGAVGPSETTTRDAHLGDLGGMAASRTADQQPAAKPAKSAHERALERAFDAKTVPGAVDLSNTTAKTVKSDIHKLANTPDKDILIHSHGAMSSELSHFKAGEMTPAEAYLATFDSAKGSPADAAILYNRFHGDHKSKQLPQGVTNEQALKSIENIMTAEGTKFDITNNLKGLGLNHGQHGEGVFDANVMSMDGKDFLVITTADGTKVNIKVENNCLNIVDIIAQLKQATPETPQSTPKATPRAPHRKKQPHAVFTVTTPPSHVGIVHRPGQPVVTLPPLIPPATPPATPPTPPSTPKPPETPKQPPKSPKDDKNKTPVGVPDEPGGSGGNGQETTQPVGGDAPAGVGQEQQPIPAPVTPAGGETTPTVPGETGTDPGTTGPGQQGNPGSTTPGGQINPGNTPVSE